LSLGIGLAQGYATLGRIGFEGRFDYAAIGSVTNLAARLCCSAEPWQVLAQHRVVAEAGDAVVSEELGSRDLRGFSRPIRTCQVRGLDLARVTSCLGHRPPRTTPSPRRPGDPSVSSTSPSATSSSTGCRPGCQ